MSISPIITIAGRGGRIPLPWLTTWPTLAHRATGGLCFPRPLPRGGRTKPATPLDLTGLEARVQKEDGHCRPGAWDPLAQRGDPLLKRVQGYPRVHPQAELCSGDFYPLDLSSETQLDPDPSRDAAGVGVGVVLQRGRDGATERRSASLCLGSALRWGIPRFLLGPGTLVLESNTRSASSSLLPKAQNLSSH